MTGSTVVVACCQVALRVGDKAGNLRRLEGMILEAANVGANVVVLPELANTGYSFRDIEELASDAEPANGSTVSGWVRLARERSLVIVGGFAESGDNGALYNSAVIVDGTGVLARYRKAHRWGVEQEFYSQGDQLPPVVDTAFGRIGLMICYDLEFPEWVRIPALAGAQLLAAPVNWPANPGPDGERPAEVVRAQADAGVNRMPVVACDRVGDERGVGWVGGTVITDADGWVLAGGWSSDREQVVVAEVDLEAAADKRVGQMSDVHADRRAALYPTEGWPVPERHPR